jgi:hypothetical protein
MNKLINLSIVIMIVFGFTMCNAQTPEKVINAFNQKFPNSTKVKWDKENAHEYEASFEFKGVKHSANFSDTGEWLETESPMTFAQLPEKVQQAFNSLHKDAKIKAVAKIETSKGITKYEVEIKKFLKTVEFLYNQDGSEIK